MEYLNFFNFLYRLPLQVLLMEMAKRVKLIFYYQWTILLAESMVYSITKLAPTTWDGSMTNPRYGFVREKCTVWLLAWTQKKVWLASINKLRAPPLVRIPIWNPFCLNRLYIITVAAKASLCPLLSFLKT